MAAGRPVGGGVDQEQEEEQNLAVGLRFRPSDEELVGMYLFNEAIGGPSVTSCLKIPLLDVYGTEPWRLRSRVDTSFSVAGEFYCFTRLKRSGRGNRIQRRTPNGCWKTNVCWNVLSGDDARRLCIGYRSLLKFFSVDADDVGNKKGKAAPWVMHEYRLPQSFWEMTSAADGDELVLCKIIPKGPEAPCRRDDDGGAESSARRRHARTGAHGEQNDPAAASSASLQEPPISPEITPCNKKKKVSPSPAGPVEAMDDSSSSSVEPTTSEKAAMDELVSMEYTSISSK